MAPDAPVAPLMLRADATNEECLRESVRQSWWRAQYDTTRRLLMDRQQDPESWSLEEFAGKLERHFTPLQRRRLAGLLRTSADRADAEDMASRNTVRRTITKSNTNRRQSQQRENRQCTHPRPTPSPRSRQEQTKPEVSKSIEVEDAEPEVEPKASEKKDSLDSENGTSPTSADYPAERIDLPEPDSLNSENGTSPASNIPDWEESL